MDVSYEFFVCGIQSKHIEESRKKYSGNNYLQNNGKYIVLYKYPVKPTMPSICHYQKHFRIGHPLEE